MERQRLRTVARQPGVTQILRRLPDAVVTFDTQWRYVFMNKQAERNHGTSAREFLGRCVWDVFPEGVDLESYRRYLLAMERQEEDSFEEYLPMFGRWFEQRLFPSPDGLTVIARDITDWQILPGGEVGRPTPARAAGAEGGAEAEAPSAEPAAIPVDANPLRTFTTFFARPGCREELAARFRDADEFVLDVQEAGAIAVELQISDDPTGPLVATALWPNAEAYERWTKLDTRTAVLESIEPLVEEVVTDRYEVVRRAVATRGRRR